MPILVPHRPLFTGPPLPPEQWVDDPDPPRWPWWLLALAGAVAVYVLLAVATLKANPVPAPAPIEGRGSRGLPELREPTAYAPSLLRLLRSCHRCHGAAGLNPTYIDDEDFTVKRHTILFDEDGRILPGIPKEKFKRGIGIVIRSGPAMPWYPTPSEKRDLQAALLWLEK